MIGRINTIDGPMVIPVTEHGIESTSDRTRRLFREMVGADAADRTERQRAFEEQLEMVLVAVEDLSAQLNMRAAWENQLRKPA